jgi:hypothetical protein
MFKHSIHRYVNSNNGQPMTEHELAFRVAAEDSITTQLRPWYNLELMDGAADNVMATRLGLKAVLYHDLITKNALIHTLRTLGPITITGRFGCRAHGGVQVKPLPTVVGEHHLHGWGSGTLRADTSILHSIVVIGAKIKNKDKCFVYWIDPNDRSDPNNLQVQRVIETPFGEFTSCIGNQIETPADGRVAAMKHISAHVFYNPLFAIENDLETSQSPITRVVSS